VTITVTSGTSPSDSRTTSSDVRGLFVFAGLAPGAYDLTASLPGFKTWKKRVEVGGGGSVTANPQLEIGALSEVIEVTGRAKAATPAEPLAVLTPTFNAYFIVAKAFYAQGQFDLAEQVTARALDLFREANPERPRGAPGPVNPNGPIRIGGNIHEPRRTQTVEPVYPADALSAGLSGSVVLEAVIGRNGSVRDLRIVKSVPMLDASARGAVQQWLYTPALLNGAPIEVAMTVTIVYNLR